MAPAWGLRQLSCRERCSRRLDAARIARVTVAPETAPADAEPARVDGRHWLLDFSGCRCASPLLADRATLEAACLDACNAAGLAVVGSRFHQFVPHGVTGVVLLAESHLSVHTWPDEHFAAVDVYVCNHAEDNGSKGRAPVAGHGLAVPGRHGRRARAAPPQRRAAPCSAALTARMQAVDAHHFQPTGQRTLRNARD